MAKKKPVNVDALGTGSGDLPKAGVQPGVQKNRVPAAGPKTTGQVIAEGAKAARMTKRRDRAIAEGILTGEDTSTVRARHVDLIKQELRDKRDRDAEEFAITGKTSGPSDAGSSIPNPTSEHPGRQTTLPTSVAEGLPNQGMPDLSGTSYYVGTGLAPAPAGTRAHETVQSGHHEKFRGAHEAGDLAAMVLHKNRLHTHMRRHGWAGDALCKNDNCGNTVSLLDYDKNDKTASPEQIERYQDSEPGEIPCKSCAASGRG